MINSQVQGDMTPDSQIFYSTSCAVFNVYIFCLNRFTSSSDTKVSIIPDGFM